VKSLNFAVGAVVGLLPTIAHLLDDWQYRRGQFVGCLLTAVIVLVGVCAGIALILNFESLRDAWHGHMLKRALQESRRRA
jgi:hypothetical protein